MDAPCPNCKSIRKTLLEYLDAQSPLFPPPTLHASALRRSKPACSLCAFLTRAAALPDSTISSDATFDIRADNHGMLYITGPGAQRTYLLPLEPSRNSLTGRERTGNCDVELLRTWLACCEAWHGADCYTPGWNAVLGSGLPLRGFRLIDVQRSCIVSASPGARYVALSYVWGTRQQGGLQATRGNVLELMEPGSLVCDWLPRTVADAMWVVRGIGEAFLWVDALCIVQDDEEEKWEQIRRMDSIYGNAVLTINAAAGESADAGLPGVRAASRHVECVTVRLSAERGLLVGQRDLQGKCDGAYWNTRGWTYQERSLSKRSITFLEDAVFFQCQRMLWCEDVCAEREDVKDYYQMEDYLPIAWSAARNKHMYKLHYALHVQRSTNWTEYLRTVEEYTPRRLSYDADGLNVFAGMSSVLSRMFASNMLTGLPESLIDCALLWQPTEPLTRRLSKEGRPLFPSWSWAAWKGAIVYEDITPHWEMLSHELITRTKLLCTWRKRSGSSDSPEAVESTGQVGSFLLEYYKSGLPAGWQTTTGGIFDIFGDTSFFHESSPERLFAVPASDLSVRISPGTQWTQLECRTKVAWVQILEDSESGNTANEPRLCSISDSSGWWIGSSRFDAGAAPIESEVYPVAIISEGVVPVAEVEKFWPPEEWAYVKKATEHLYSFYNVMILDKLDISSQRIGLGKIGKKEWEKLGAQEIGIALV